MAAGEALPQGEQALGEQLDVPLQKSVEEVWRVGGEPNGWQLGRAAIRLVLSPTLLLSCHGADPRLHSSTSCCLTAGRSSAA